jgi:cytochrome c2
MPRTAISGLVCTTFLVLLGFPAVPQEPAGKGADTEAGHYGFSSAMKGADFVWDKEKLDRFIAKPDEIVPGNNMKPYGGLTSAEDRARVIMFLESPTTN